MLKNNNAINPESPVAHREVSGLIFDIDYQAEILHKSICTLTERLDVILSPNAPLCDGVTGEEAKTATGQKLQSILNSLKLAKIRIDQLSQRAEI